MSSPPYTPEKYELQSFPGQFAESQIPLSFIGQEVPMDTPNLKHDWQGMPKAKRQRPDRLSSALVLTKALLMPMLAIGYLTFCYVVHYYVVPVRAHGIIDVSPQNLGEQCFASHMVKSSCASSSFYQGWGDHYQHFDNHSRTLTLKVSNQGTQSKWWPTVAHAHSQLIVL